MPFKFGLKIGANVLHADSATRGKIATPIDVKDKSANSVLIKVRNDEKKIVSFAPMDTIRQEKQKNRWF